MALSFCVTTYNRFNLTIQSFEKILDDERVSEIVISDDTYCRPKWQRR